MLLICNQNLDFIFYLIFFIHVSVIKRAITAEEMLFAFVQWVAYETCFFKLKKTLFILNNKLYFNIYKYICILEKNIIMTKLN
jgi:hypothetical protein